MNTKDLKVGMVFNYVAAGDFAKIFKIFEDRVFYYQFTSHGHFDCQSTDGGVFLQFYTLIGKVPPKIVEVEEEVPVYISKRGFDSITQFSSILVNDANLYNFDETYVLSIDRNLIKYPLELCKIKRKIKKELNFNWDSGDWE